MNKKLKTIVWLGALLVVLNMLDVLTTYMGLSVGAEEANPVSAALIKYGPFAFIGVKLAISLFVAGWLIFATAVYEKQLYRFSLHALVALNIFYMMPVLWNTIGYIITVSR